MHKCWLLLNLIHITPSFTQLIARSEVTTLKFPLSFAAMSAVTNAQRPDVRHRLCSDSVRADTLEVLQDARVTLLTAAPHVANYTQVTLGLMGINKDVGWFLQVE